MFESIQPAPPDAILGLNESFQKDPRAEKVNLTVGVYKDESGTTPILDAVKEAERRLIETETTKSYLSMGGDPDFNRRVRALLLGEDAAAITEGRAVTIQTPGGTAGLRVAADFLVRNGVSRRIWCSRPTWANHHNVFRSAGLDTDHYAYLDDSGTRLDGAAMLESLRQIPPGDVVCLHGCCHNPTGVDPTAEEWTEIIEVARERRWLPLIDLAYQGFGEGLDADAQAVRRCVNAGLEVLVAHSYSKNFGLYAERTGAVTAVTASADQASAVESQLKAAVRSNYSNPPKHGAAIVATILADDSLRQQWLGELAAMRDRIRDLRSQLVAGLTSRLPDRDFHFIEAQKGMFSFSGLTPLQVDRLKTEHAVYIVRSGRINIAGLNASNLDRVCDAIAAVLK